MKSIFKMTLQEKDLNNVRDRVLLRVSEQVGNKIRIQVKCKTFDQVRSQVWTHPVLGQVRDQTWWQIRAKNQICKL